MLRSAKKSDKEAILKLWQSCFGDSESYINLYLEKKFDPEKTVLLEINDRVFGMAHLLPCTLYPEIKALYWYAVCIDEDMRGRGLFRYLVTEVLKETKKRGYANVCVPAVGLEEVYQRFGFHYPYYGEDLIFFDDKTYLDDDKVKISVAKSEDFLGLHKEKGSTSWDLEAIQYACLENEFSGGMQLKILFHGQTYPLFVIKKEKYFLLDYHNMDLDTFKLVKNNLMKYLNVDKMIFRCQIGNKIIGLCDHNSVSAHSKISFILG